MSARLGVELLSGLGTGAVAATGWVGRILFGLDVASNVSLGGQGAIGIANDSPTIQNTTNLLFGLMGLGGGFISKALSKANLPAEETVETVVDTLNTARQRTDNALDNAADQVATEIVDKIVDAEKAAPDAAKVSEVARELPQVASRTQPPGRPVGPDDEVPNGFSYDLDDPRFQTYSEGGSKIDFRIDENTLKIDWIEGPNASSFLKEIIDAHDGNIDRIIGFTSDKLGDASDEVVLRAANKIAASLGGGWRTVIEFRDGKRHVILTR